MAPWNEALKVTPVAHEDGVFQGKIDSEWTIGFVPHGGYVLAILLEACLIHQRGTSHPDPIHISAHFLRSCVVGPCKVHVETLKDGGTLKTLTAKLAQKDQSNIVATLVFGRLPPFNAPPTTTSGSEVKPVLATLTPPSPYSRLSPFKTHPSNCTFETLPWRMSWKQHMHWAPDHAHVSPTRTHGQPGPPTFAGWTEFTDSDKDRVEIGPSALAFLVDVYENLGILVPELGMSEMWYPTVFLAIEFKFAIPPAQNTAGVYAQGQYVNEGRHDTYVEVWSAPSNTDGIGAKWREESRCLCTSIQMNLSVSPSVNIKRGKGKL